MIINQTIFPAMLKNFLITATRNIWRNRGYSLINIVGLALGLTSFFLIILYVYHECSFDQHFKDADRVYRISMHGQMPGNNFKTATSGGTLGRFFYEEIPEVEAYTRFYQWNNSVLFRVGEKRLYQDHILYADSNFFDIFNYKVLAGSVGNALTQPYRLVLTLSVAKKYYGDADPVGQQILLNNEKQYIVTAVIEDPNPKSHLNFEVLASLSTLEDHPRLGRYVNEITAFIMYNYIRLMKGTSPENIAVKTREVIKKHYGEMMEMTGSTVEADLQPLTGIHLHSNLVHELSSNGDATRVYLFTAIAFLILVIASINFMNLYIAKSGSRALEVGIRKAVGSHRYNLLGQFLTESLMITFISLILAILLVELVLPYYNSFTGISLVLRPDEKFVLLLIMAGCAATVGILSGLYPAFFLASFDPVKVLKGKTHNGRKFYSLTNLLVTFQYAVSVFLICSSIVIYLQLDYMTKKDLGIDMSEIVVVPLRETRQVEQYQVLKGELGNIPGILDVTGSSTYLGKFEQRRAFIPEGRPRDEMWMLNFVQVDYNYLDMMSAKIILGRDFSSSDKSDTASIIVNTTLARELEWDDPLGKVISLPSVDPENDIRFKVIGVVEDFHFASLHQPVEPLIIMYSPRQIRFLGVKTDPAVQDKIMSRIEKKWNAMFPETPFNFFMQETSYREQYADDFKVRRVLLSFTLLAVFIASIGIFGLALLSSARRTREVGIRKVYGSSILNIFVLLGKRLVFPILVSCLVALPVTWYYLGEWLDGFAFHIRFPLWSFLLATTIVILSGILTISITSMKAARNNPVDVLRYE